jgi:hypothetical protein
MGNSQLLFETDTVPFLQMVLSGCMEYFAPYTNVGFGSAKSLLRTLEFGAYPSFLLTGVENRQLKDTPYEELFTSYYKDWLPEISNVYSTISGVLNRVAGQSIVDHKALGYGVTKTSYGNGVSIYVNYGLYDFNDTAEGITVPAQGYFVR